MPSHINTFWGLPAPHRKQKFSVPGDIILDLPGMRVRDISISTKHKIQNYGIVFAPRAGHHSNIAERVAIAMRDHGLTRMAIVEQKCADEIPLYVNGRRHYENFDGQVKQYKSVLEYLKGLTGYSSHTVAICQPGPLLMATTILYPELVKTFGSAGSPMCTAPGTGKLSDFAKLAGEKYIDFMIDFFGYTVPDCFPGAGRRCFDGRLQVLAFYLFGAQTHTQNAWNLFFDLCAGNNTQAQKQIDFYEWYNLAHHSSAGFMRDTFKKIFVRNELMNGNFSTPGRNIGISDFPAHVPIWAIAGVKDEIAPPAQAIGHMKDTPAKNKLEVLCSGGHMGLFRSSKILTKEYEKITKFCIHHSD